MERIPPPADDDASQSHALREIVRRFLGRIVRDDATADDLTSETMLVVFGRDAAGVPIRKRPSFALGVAWRKSCEARRARRPSALLDEDSAPATAAIDPGRATELREWLAVAFAQLDADDRALLALRFEEDLSYREIAATLGIGVPLVGWRLRRARTELQKALNRTGGGAGVSLGAALLMLFAPTTARAAAATAGAVASGAAASAGAGPFAGIFGAITKGGGSLALAKATAGCALVLAIVLGAWWWIVGTPPEPMAEADGAGRATVVVPERAAEEPEATAESAATRVVAAPFADVSAPAVAVVGLALDGRGRPVAGATVRAYVAGDPRTPAGPAATSDERGRFRAPLDADPPPARVDLVAMHADFPAVRRSDVAVSEPTHVVRFRRGATLRGVVRGADGAPLAGVAVAMRGDPAARTEEERFVAERSTTTDAQGAYAFTIAPDPDRFDYVVEFSKTNFVPTLRRAAHALEDGGEEDVAAYRLDAALRPGTPVVGVVLDRAGGRPVAGAVVELGVDIAPLGGRDLAAQLAAARQATPPVTTTTDASGVFRAPGIDPALAAGTEIGVRVVATNYVAYVGKRPFEDPSAAGKRVVVRLTPGVSVRGRVLDAQSRPVSRVDVAATWRAAADDAEERRVVAKTDADGVYRLVALDARPGTKVTTTVVGPPAPPRGFGAPSPHAEPRAIVARAEGESVAPDLLMRTDSRPCIKVRVVDSEGRPIPHARYAAGPATMLDLVRRAGGSPGAVGAADAAGAIVLFDLDDRARPAALRIAAPGYAPVTTEEFSFAGPTAARETRVVLPPARRVRGRVVHADGAPARACVVQAEAEYAPSVRVATAGGGPPVAPPWPRILGTTTTDDDGLFSFDELEAVPVVLRAKARGPRLGASGLFGPPPGYALPAEAASTPLTGDQETIVLTLPVPAGRGGVSARVRRADGGAAAGAKGTLLRDGTSIAAEVADAATNQIVFRGVAVGRYVLRLESNDGPASLHDVAVRDGRRTEVVATHGPAGLVSGRVVAVDGGAPPVGTRVYLSSDDGTKSFASETDAEGRFPIAGAAPGTWRASAKIPRRGRAVEAGWGEFTLDADLVPAAPIRVALRAAEECAVRFVGAYPRGATRFRAEARDAAGGFAGVVHGSRLKPDDRGDQTTLIALPRGELVWRFFADDVFVAERRTPYAGEAELTLRCE